MSRDVILARGGVLGVLNHTVQLFKSDWLDPVVIRAAEVMKNASGTVGSAELFKKTIGLIYATNLCYEFL